MRKRPNNENLEYKKLLAEARKIIEEEKRESWEKFCRSIDFNTQQKKIGISLKS